METQPTHPSWKRGCPLTCARLCVCVSGVGRVSFSCLGGARERRQHCLPAPHEDTGLAAVILFCFCHILRGLSHPPPSPWFVSLPVCHLFINFVLREQMAGAESGRMCLPPPLCDKPLEHAAHAGCRLPSFWISQTKTDFQDRPHVPLPDSPSCLDGIGPSTSSGLRGTVWEGMKP